MNSFIKKLNAYVFVNFNHIYTMYIWCIAVTVFCLPWTEQKGKNADYILKRNIDEGKKKPAL